MRYLIERLLGLGRRIWHWRARRQVRRRMDEILARMDGT